MEWYPKSAATAYLDALKLCHKCNRNCNSCDAQMPASTEFLSALAAGMSAKLIVEVTPEVSSTTVALAAAARETGGKLVCIVPEPKLVRTQKEIEESGLIDMVEFRTEDPAEALLNYENIDFSFVNCKAGDYERFIKNLDVNPKKSMVVANNLLPGEEKLGEHLKEVEKRTEVRSMRHLIGEGMEIAMIGKGSDLRMREMSKSARNHGIPFERKTGIVKKTDKSRWVFRVDETSGEEHIFRIPRSA